MLYGWQKHYNFASFASPKDKNFNIYIMYFLFKKAFSGKKCNEYNINILFP